MSTLGKVAYVFMVISTVVSGFCLIPLCWTIPMTLKYKKNNGHVSVGFKVCMLIFVNTVSGILALCDRSVESK